VRWAPLERADWPAAQALLIESEGHDRTGPRILHGWRHQLAPISDDRADTLAARTDDGTIVALGWLSVRPHDDPPRRVFLAGTVHPGYRRRGLGRQLLDWQLEVARRWQSTVGGDPILIVASTAPLPDVQRLLTDAGFSPARVFAELSRTLPRSAGEAGQRAASLPKGQVEPGEGTQSPDEPTERVHSPEERALDLSKGRTERDRSPSPSEGGSQIVLAPFSFDRADEVRVVLNISFADHWGARALRSEPWQAVLAAETFRPDWSWLALADGRIVGFVLNSAAPHPTLGSVGWTDQLGVLPAARGRGIGRALMEASLAAFERAGLQLAGLGVDTQNQFGATSLYDRLGYRPGYEVHLFTRSEPAPSRNASRKPMS
jgi:ribosomal protein S18 acetylase RimI-like enzyme